MRHRIVLVVLVAAGVVAASGTAFAVANSVSTTPPPAFISHLDKSIVDHPDPTTSDDPQGHDTNDDHGDDAATSTTVVGSSTTADDDHGANRGQDGPDDSADDHRGPSAQSGPGSTQAPSTTVAGGATTTDDDDEASTTSVTTVTTIDDDDAVDVHVDRRPRRRWQGRIADARSMTTATTEAAAASPARPAAPAQAARARAEPSDRSLRADDRRQVALSPHRGLCPVGDVDASEDVGEVCLHGALRDPEASGDLLVRETCGDEPEHLDLARAELLVRAHSLALEQHACSLRIERRVARSGSPDRAE